MYRFLHKGIQFLLYGNIFIALAGAGLTLQTYLLIDMSSPSIPLLLMVFSATLLAYIAHRMLSSEELDGPDLSERMVWVKSNWNVLIGIAGASLLGAAIAFFHLGKSIRYVLILLGIMNIAYTMPFWKRRRKRISLRAIWYFKTIIIVFVWTTVTVLLPLLDIGIVEGIRSAPWLIMERLCFVSAIAVAFDIRDVDYDKQARIMTIPIWLGVSGAKIMSGAFLILFAMLSLIHYMDQMSYLIPMLISAVATLVVIGLIKKGAHEYFYIGLLDGMLLLQPILLILFKGY